jgi:hypothetical protein
MRQAASVHPIEFRPSRHDWNDCYHGHMHKRSDATHSNVCGGIPCIVHAVRAGDDRLIGILLRRFAQHAEIETLFQLRSALNTDAHPADASPTTQGECGIGSRENVPSIFDDQSNIGSCRLGTFSRDRRRHPRHGGPCLP